MRRDHATISAKVLSARLKDLETRCVLIRSVRQTRPPTVEYSLTELGAQLIPIIRAIVDVGSDLHVRQTEAFRAGGMDLPHAHVHAENSSAPAPNHAA